MNNIDKVRLLRIGDKIRIDGGRIGEVCALDKTEYPVTLQVEDEEGDLHEQRYFFQKLKIFLGKVEVNGELVPRFKRIKEKNKHG